jgi:serine/threonine protein phosphatase PrpC
MPAVLVDQPTKVESPSNKTGAAGLIGLGLTDVGRQRSHNEDTLYVDNDIGLYVVCDGMGGHVAGSTASMLAVRTIVEFVDSLNPADTQKEAVLPAAIKQANEAVFKKSMDDAACRGMGTTVVALLEEVDGIHLCHAGDSRIYLLRGGNLQRVTRDHSLENLYRDQPELVGQLGPATSNVIVRAVGLEPSVEVEHTVMQVRPGDTFLLCSDGLSDTLSDSTIKSIMLSPHPLDAMVRALVKAANDAGGNDNISVILVRPKDTAPPDDDGETLVSDGKRATTEPGY